MKKLIVITIIALCNGVYAQTPTLDAFKKSYAAEATKDYSGAISAYTPVYSKTSYSMNLRLGWLYYLNADYLKSKTYYTIAIGLNNKSIEARTGLIYPLSAMNNWDEVMKVYKAILTIDVNNTSAHYQLAYIYFVRKKYTEAEGHLKTVLSFHPFDYDSNALLGSTYVKMGKIQEAKKHYSIALEYNPYAEDILQLYKGL